MEQPLEIELEDRPCPLCERRDDELILVTRDREFDLPGDFGVVRCRYCSLLRTNPRPTAEAIGRYYPDEYPNYRELRDPAPAGRTFAMVRSLARAVVQFNSTRLPPLPPGRALEIGCGTGEFLDELRAAGWDVTGIEMSEKAAAQARAVGHEVHVGRIEDAPPPEKPYDAVAAWMVLEHVHDPVLALERVRDWTRPRGWLAVSVPNAGSFEFRVFGRRWYALMVPRHLYHFTPATLTRLLERTGWSVQKIFHQRSLANVVGSFGHLLEDLGLDEAGRWTRTLPERTSRLEYALYPVSALLAALRQTGRITVLAQRAG